MGLSAVGASMFFRIFVWVVWLLTANAVLSQQMELPPGKNLADLSNSNFIRLKLPRAVELDLPKGWWSLGSEELKLIATSLEAAMDLSGTAVPRDEKKITLIAANSMPKTTYAAIRINSVTPPSVTRDEYKAITRGDLAQMQQQTRQILAQMMQLQGNALIEGSLKVRLEEFADFPAFVTEYRRTGPQGPVSVQLMQVFRPTDEITINLSYRESETVIWKTVIEKVRRSIVLSAPARIAETAHRSDLLLCNKPDYPDAPTYSMEIVKGGTDKATELRVTGSIGITRYKVTKETGATYAAEELEPSATDAVGTLFLDRLTGRLITTNRISFPAVAILVKVCDGNLTVDGCSKEMEAIPGGNQFACHRTRDRCERWRNNSNVLAIHVDTCVLAARKF
jgi:hypothetical protein